MKRVLKFLFVIFIFCPTLFLCGCIGDSADRRFNTLLKLIEEKNTNGVKDLFSKKTIDSSLDFDSDVENLILYYEGSFVSSISHGVLTSDSNEGGVYSKQLDLCYEVKTTVADYRIAVNWNVVDPKHKDEVGITSLYIILYEKDQNQDKYYTVMDSNERGIFIERQRGI